MEVAAVAAAVAAGAPPPPAAAWPASTTLRCDATCVREHGRFCGASRCRGNAPANALLLLPLCVERHFHVLAYIVQRNLVGIGVHATHHHAHRCLAAAREDKDDHPYKHAWRRPSEAHAGRVRHEHDESNQHAEDGQKGQIRTRGIVVLFEVALRVLVDGVDDVSQFRPRF